MPANPSAFPSPGVVMPGYNETFFQQGAYEGMSLRDYFAAKAMQAWINGMINTCVDVKEAFTGGIDAPQTVATFAYVMADVMLAARENNDG